MVTISQRIAELRAKKGLSCPALSAALGLPRMTAEKMEQGKLTPTAEQQEKLAAFFGVSTAYLRGESSDPTSMENWMEAAWSEPDQPAPAQKRPQPRPVPQEGSQGTMMDALLSSEKFRQAMREAALEALRSPEGQAVLENLVKKALDAKK
jgi:transcriptional regulator with XRE-family HTH domain